MSQATDALRQLADKIRDLGKPGSTVQKDIARRLGEAAMKQLLDGFQQQRDPYGRPWAPFGSGNARMASYQKKLEKAEASLGRANRSHRGDIDRVVDRRIRAEARVTKLRRQHPLLLLDTGRMRAGYNARPTADGFKVSNRVEYARYHQYGTKTIAQRQMVPEQATGGLGLWGDALNREAEVALHDFFGKR